MSQERLCHSEKLVTVSECNSVSNLVCDLVAGDEKAFHKIFNLYHHSVYRHVMRFVKSPDLASDITQDVFIKIWENRESIQPAHSFSAYLFAIAKNHVLNILKRAAKEKDIKKEIFTYALDFHNQNEEDNIFADLVQFANHAIENLPPQRKLIFKMFKDEGKDYHQIAAILGVSKNTVRDHLTKASKFIRGYLKLYTGINGTILTLLAHLFI